MNVKTKRKSLEIVQLYINQKWKSPISTWGGRGGIAFLKVSYKRLNEGTSIHLHVVHNISMGQLSSLPPWSFPLELYDPYTEDGPALVCSHSLGNCGVYPE